MESELSVETEYLELQAQSDKTNFHSNRERLLCHRSPVGNVVSPEASHSKSENCLQDLVPRRLLTTTPFVSVIRFYMPSLTGVQWEN